MSQERKLLPGKPYPLGAKANAKGTNFAVYSEHATGVSVCFFDDSGKQTDCIALRERTAFVWHPASFLASSPVISMAFAWKVPGSPKRGNSFNPNKLLVDPYAEAISGQLDWKAPPVFPATMLRAATTPNAMTRTAQRAYPRAWLSNIASTGAMIVHLRYLSRNPLSMSCT